MPCRHCGISVHKLGSHSANNARTKLPTAVFDAAMDTLGALFFAD